MHTFQREKGRHRLLARVEKDGRKKNAHGATDPSLRFPRRLLLSKTTVIGRAEFSIREQVRLFQTELHCFGLDDIL